MKITIESYKLKSHCDSTSENNWLCTQGGSDKVTRSCDKNVDESAILRMPSFSVELTLVYFYSLCSCLVFSVYR